MSTLKRFWCRAAPRTASENLPLPLPILTARAGQRTSVDTYVNPPLNLTHTPNISYLIKVQFGQKPDNHLDNHRKVGLWSVFGDDVTVRGFVKEPTKVRTYTASQKVRGHGRVVITKVGAIAVTHVPPYPKEQGRLQITSEKTSKKSFRKISAHLSSPQESAAAWLSAHAFNP